MMLSDDDKTRAVTVLTKGTVIHHYRIVEKIGAGGMGEVYLAEDTKLDRKVALKFLPHHLCQSEDCRARFKREAQASAKLDHPSIVAVFEVGEFEGRPFFAMQHVEGQTLKEVIAAKAMPLDRILEIGIQICDGLQAAHEKGITHRDIKPSNILIDSHGRARIVDFGLAKVRDAEEQTQIGSTLGTIGYMPPEQVLGKEIDNRSDLFSLGVVIYEMVSGRNPFRRSNQTATQRAILEEVPEPLAKQATDVPAALERAVNKLLEKGPQNRYQDALSLAADLKHVEHALIEACKPADAGPSIAVLPFSNLSADPEQEFFCDGMAEEIINALTKVESLRVVARTSCFAFKGKNEDIRTIGDRLSVSTVLEGSVRKSGDRLRITAQLINVVDGYHLWSERYDRKLEDVFDIQDEISLKIVDVLKVKLLSGKKAALTKHFTNNLEAYNLYLKGRHFWNQRTKSGLLGAKSLFEKALELELDYAPALAGLADTYLMLRSYHCMPSDEALSKARELVMRALSIDETMAEPHASLGHLLHSHEWKWAEAEAEYKKSIKLNPNYPTARQWYGLLLCDSGRFDEALEQTNLACQLDPLSSILGFARGYVLMAARRFEEAERLGRQMNADFPESTFGNAILDSIQNAMGNPGISWIANSVLSDTDLIALQEVRDSGDWRDVYRKAIELLELRNAPGSCVVIAQCYLFLREEQSAFDALEKAFAHRESDLTQLAVDPIYDPVRSDPRYLSLIKRVGLEDAAARAAALMRQRE